MDRRDSSLPENLYVETLARIERDIRELKAGNQFVDARMFPWESGAAYDYTETMAAGAASTVASVIAVTVSSTDGSQMLATMVPELFVGTTSNKYIDTLAGVWDTATYPNPTADSSSIQFLFRVVRRQAVGAPVTMYLKVRAYGTAPISVGIAKIS